MSNRILVIDDKENIRKLLGAHLSGEGYSVDTAEDGENGLAMYRGNRYDLVITDVKMPGLSGLDVLQEIRKLDTDAVVLLITAFADMDDAINAMKMGAFDYLKKPFKLEEIQATVEKAFENRRLRRENKRLRREVNKQYQFEDFVSKSEIMQEVFTRIRKVSGAGSTVLVTGETGTGKELVARAIHVNSPRKDKPFVVVNCGAIPETLIESELYGHVRGAFTDAIATRPGRFEDAHGGTIFLDEIGELALSMQGKLLRTLQEGEITRIGETKTRNVDVRVIAATNKNLEQEVSAGRFRTDLFYRINVVPIHLPPLRDRREDIPLLLNHYLESYCDANKMPVMSFGPRAMARLLNFAWPGNVRELMNVVERCVLMSENNPITEADLPRELVGDAGELDIPGGFDPDALFVHVPRSETSLKKILDRATPVIEKEMIRRALESADNNKDRAAKILEISRRSLFYKIKEYGID